MSTININYKKPHIYQLDLPDTYTDIAYGLRDVRITVPIAVKRGDNAQLICNYDLEGDTLYSVKWYKGSREFYRYLPKEKPAIKLFPVAGIVVDVSLLLYIYN